MTGDIHDNRIYVDGSTSVDGVIVGMRTGDSYVRIYGNHVRGRLATGISVNAMNPALTAKAIVVSNAVQRTAPAQYEQGIAVTQFGQGSMSAKVLNNTAVGFGNGVSFNGRFDADFFNNIVAYNAQRGFHIQDAQVNENHNLYFGNGGSTPPLGPDTLTLNPLFADGTHDLRLSPGSPAIGAGDDIVLRSLYQEEALPQIDADGLRRFKHRDADTDPDIGAFEFGDASLIHRVRAFNTTGNASAMSDPLLQQADQTPLLTPSLAPDTFRANADPVVAGVDFSGGTFRVVNEGGGSLAAGSAYHVFVPAAGRGRSLHLNAGGEASYSSDVDIHDADLFGYLLLLSHRAGISGQLPHVAGFGSGILMPQIYTLDYFPIPQNQQFHIYSQDPSIAADNLVRDDSLAGPAFPISHPLTDGDPCARIYVTPAANWSNAKPVGVDFDQQSARWIIRNLDGSAIPTGAEFNLLVDEAAGALCRRDHVFHDDFGA
ncbi:right-handed parallel beta-helix repeat-containing protein [Tahibacter amnicola]|uniref:Right-handed parallel beta-helix repeat-containing protein n=1 Tax=Tahibacter amnicola TaxID=2976241 RepID=A0ABY6BFT1_9GAMM|nr:right-handed parallel beta-helix repeat-containing protein [Tahibacter amnicola]UXI68685.1 right-handed parallel beta-helix repeat-containing protein [Tahibacter amnicola]